MNIQQFSQTPPLPTSHPGLEALADGFLAVDPAWSVTYWNAAAERMFNLPREEILRGGLWTRLPCFATSAVAQALREVARSGSPRRVVARLPPCTLSLLSLQITPISGGGVAVQLRDASDEVNQTAQVADPDRFSREQQLALLALEAREANQAKSRFFAAVSHELRTPLNAIVGYTHLLATETYGPLPDPARRAADRAGICAEHLSRLVDDLLLLTATELGRVSVTPSSVRLPALLRTAAEPHRIQAEGKGLSFDLQIPAEVPEIQTDAERLRQLLNALLNNAIKFTKRGSITLSARMIGPELEISVTDTGPGIPIEERERIFSPFERLDDLARSNPLANGAGLGLTVARQLAALLRGKLCLDESVETGCRFCLTIPARFENR